MAQPQYKSIDLRGYLDLNKNELRNVTLQNLGADIGSPNDGLLFYRSDTDRARLRANGVWEDLAFVSDVTATSIPSSIVDVKGDLIVASAADTVIRLAAGANDTILVANSGTASGLEWRAIADADIPSTIARDSEVFLKSAYTTKGDIAIATGASVPARHGVGANGTFLVANSAQGDGWENRAIVAGDISEKIATNDLTDWPRVADLDLNGQKITGLADGTAITDAATFGQLNAIVTGMKWKDSVDAATTANITLSGTQTVDGVVLAVGDRVLVKNQTAGENNGIYLVAAGAWTRTTDADSAAEVNDATVLIDAGTVNQGDVYTQTATVVTLGTTVQTWTKTGEGNTVYTADGTTITLTGQSFSIATGGITNTHINSAAAIAYSKLNLANSVVNADVAAGAAIAYSKLNLAGSLVYADVAVADTTTRILRKFAAAITGGATTEVVTHNLNTRDISSVSLINPSTPWDMVEVEWAATSVNTVTLTSPVNLPATYRCVVSG